MAEEAFVAERVNIADWFLDRQIREGRGDKTAIIDDASRYSYGEVQRLANRYGNHLIRLGVRQEERVIVSLPDGVDFAAALFGALKIGAVVVMVNPHLDREQFDYFLEYTRARAVVCNPAVSKALVEATVDARHVTSTVTDRAEVAAADEQLECADTHRDDPAIWLFSGGTTGRPKAVVQPHRSFVNSTHWYAHGVLGMSASDITLSIPKLFFGYATGSNLLFPFSVGATAVLFAERPTPEVLFAQIAAHRPTVLINVPTMINRMVAHASAGEQDLSCLRLTTSAGEALPVELHRRWDDTFGGELLDGLGTAEMWHVFLTNRPGDVKPGTLGRVVPGFEIGVRDDDGNPVEDGEVGTMWVRGDSLAHGYWQNVEKTQAAFYGPWYRSEDLITRDADGYVTYCGRSGDMFKVSGRWVASNEIENCLLQHSAVKEAAVVGSVDAASGLTKPKAFVIPVESRDGLTEQLKQHVLDHLDAYKTPREVILVDDLPRTHLGKVDRGKLKALNTPG